METTWTKLKNEITAALRRGAHDDAERLLVALHAEAKVRAEPELVCNTWFTEGLVRDAQRRFDEAERAFATALQMDEKLRGPDHPSAAETLHSLGIVRNNRGDHAGALDAYRRAAAILRVRRPFQVADALTAVAGQLIKLGRLDEAVSTYDDAIAAARAEPKTPLADGTKAFLGAGEALRQSRRFPEAFARLATATQTSSPKMWPQLTDLVTRAWYTLGIVSRHGLQGATTQAAFAFWYATQPGAARAVRDAATAQLAELPERTLCTGDPATFRLVYRDAADNLHVASFAHGLHHLRQPLDVVLGAPVDVTLEDRRAVAVRPRDEAS